MIEEFPEDVMLQGKTIVFGVCGGIAVYKAVDIVSRLKKLGASVHVVMTKNATEFVAPLTFREISQNPVICNMWEEPKQWNVQHIALARAADIVVIAPATANFIGKIANGIADDMLTTTVMATEVPVLVVPAMNTAMYDNPITQRNIEKLITLGYDFIEPASGLLACGEVGRGKLPDPVVIVERIEQKLHSCRDLSNRHILVTAAGTREPIDPVRYVGNRSSGKMGFAIAQAARDRGATVTLITGPTALRHPHGVTVQPVETAREMYDAVMKVFDQVDVVIKAAAVADYRPKHVADQKIKKNDDVLTVVMERNPDILMELGRRKTKQLLIGFAAETQDLLTNARTKMTKKNLDMLVANDVTLPGAGFNADTNIVKLLHRDGQVETLPQQSKRQVANSILERVITLLNEG